MANIIGRSYCFNWLRKITGLLQVRSTEARYKMNLWNVDLVAECRFRNTRKEDDEIINIRAKK